MYGNGGESIFCCCCRRGKDDRKIKKMISVQGWIVWWFYHYYLALMLTENWFIVAWTVPRVNPVLMFLEMWEPGKFRKKYCAVSCWFWYNPLGNSELGNSELYLKNNFEKFFQISSKNTPEININSLLFRNRARIRFKRILKVNK